MAEQRYHVIERIDAGGMAEVFKANSSSLQGFEKLVAIKRILPNLTKNERFVRMFLDEAKVSLHLSHTNCVQVFDLGLADGTYFIVMEFVDGVNLKHIIDRYKQAKALIPVEKTAYVATEICKGLAHAHRKVDQKGSHLAIVHRDISPPNVLVSVEGEVKITDFGLAKAKSQVETTDPGIVKGKFGYLSPEAAHGEEVDLRTDIFATGILMWEMLTGERLFLGETDIDTLQKVRKNEVPPLSNYRDDVPESLEKIIRRALASDPKQRYQRSEELGRDLTKFLFDYGAPVSAFDISELASQLKREQRKPTKRTEKDKAIEQEIQQAINRIVPLEEIDDLDLYMAEMYGSMEGEGNSPAGFVEGSFEDPRMWADVGLDDDDFSIRGLNADSEAAADGEEWHHRNVDALSKRRTMPGAAVVPPVGDKTAEMENPQAVLADRAAKQAAAQAAGVGPGKAKSEMGMRTRQMHAIEAARSPQMRDAAEAAKAASQAAQANGAQQQLGKMPIQQVDPRAAAVPRKRADTGEIIPDSGGKKSNTGLYIVLLIIVVLLAAAAGFVYLQMNGQLPI